MTGYFSVRNFEKFQHYKDRNPPWIRLYNSLLDSYEYAQLPDASKAHLVAIFLLASRSGNRIPADTAWLKAALHATEIVDLSPLINANFIIPDQQCIELLASSTQDAPQSRAEEIKNKPSAYADPPLEKPDVISLAVEAWNELAIESQLSPVQRLTDQRRRSLAARLRECGGLEGWARAISKIRGSPFLLGDNDRGWKADFDFLMQPKSFTKLMEGGYDFSFRQDRATGKPTAEDDQRAILGALHIGASGGLGAEPSSATGSVIDNDPFGDWSGDREAYAGHG